MRWTEWSAALRSTSVARPRVGRMFSRRFSSLIDFQIPVASSTASPSESTANRWKNEAGSANAVSRSARNRSTYHCWTCVGLRVDVDREVEEVRHREPGAPVGPGPGRLQDVEPLDDQHVRPLHDRPLAGHDVVREVGVDRCLHVGRAGLDLGHEAQQRALVVRLREALAVEDARVARARRSGAGTRRW